jgi:hypothetical protein
VTARVMPGAVAGAASENRTYRKFGITFSAKRRTVVSSG